MEELKSKVVSEIKNVLDERLKMAQQTYNDALESRNNDTKSSAGDKYETSRAMMQQEMDNAQRSIHQIKMMRNELFRLPIQESNLKATAGALITTNSGKYFLGLSMGKVLVGEHVVFAISTGSPLGKLLLNKKEGDRFVLNNMEQEILSIE
ncbi:hypothetical protein CW751_07620 [Brumimicrobium salinarum]|uniref:3-oxoacyl-ACP synthase n=1 Tax=Brumimicrobium salinarum TaxID=2058658 RepID=A0A2I0R374_9FLAO|nr:hypothetical protein [Brumimicrobium salinarum]PKR81026.1 hypothetical protein CW751_07620 [Brumimicrobium salinarum]